MPRHRHDLDDSGEPFKYAPPPGTTGRYAAGRHRETEPAPTGRPSASRDVAANLVRDHELARMRAKFVNGQSAWPDLVEQLNFAHLQAGKPSLSVLGAQVRYSKATLSKVLTGKMMPSWKLVQLLGAALRVPTGVIVQEWFPLWTAAEMHRAKRLGAIRGTAKVPAPGEQAAPSSDPVRMATGTSAATIAAITEPTGYTCPSCGSWVVDTPVHTAWHMRMDRPGQVPPAAEPITGGTIPEREIRLLREALGQNDPLL
ncbi:hypothetical protein ACQP2E_02440 [Actinoplanes sp. CA-015351]|uniref:hypothetical protein n=1 Tax=Actinoplanes sp. CA-015351 TaxID=3239897 RepID=UPI003D99CF95